jgi:Glycogen debranching enzyme
MILTRTIVLLLLLAPAFGFSNNPLKVADLTCEYLVNPVGIEAKNPRLAWIIYSKGRSIKQTAYRVIVSNKKELIEKGEGDWWDSGKVPSGQSIQVAYGGPALAPAASYYWRVQVWDNKGHVSEWSPVASWQTGITDWANAAWIGYDELPADKRIVPAMHGGGKPEMGKLANKLPLLRKEFNATKSVQQATIFISGLGHFELSMNGQKIGDHFLDPGWTNYGKHALYVGFDVTGQLHQGANAIGVMLGNGFYHVPAERYRKLTGSFGHPKMICRLVIRYQDGSTENIVSNESWKVAAGPVTFTSIYGGEDYDARLEQDGWNKAGFADNSWKPAMIVEGPPAITATITEPLKVMQEFTPVKVTQPKPGVYLYDLGQNFSGIPQITVSGARGSSIKITPGEILDENGLVSQRPSGGPSYFTYTLKGGGSESWQPQFTYYGFRYLQVEGDVPVIKKIKGLHTRHSARTTGSFSCSNKLFNDIFTLIDWSVKSNMASVLTDCPHREKLGWLEVPHLLGNSVRYNYDIASFYRKIIEDMKMSQTADGLVPNIAPEYTQFDTDFRDSPEWGSSSVILPYSLYQWYGDKQVLAESYDMMKRYVDYLGAKAKDHIVSHGLGDWFDIGPNGSGSGYSVSTPQGITGTAIYYYDLQILVETATLLNKMDDANKYRQLAAEVKTAFNNKFFNRETKQYGTGSQTANAMAVYMKLVDPEYKDAVVENIIKNIRARNNSLSSGEVGYKHLVAVLEAEGRSDVVYDMNSRDDVPGYGYQIAHGATTLMEDWQAIKTLGNNHCMLGHLMGWLYSGLGGIRQQDIAFKKILIQPEMVGDIKWVETTYRSPYGDIVCEWEKKKGKIYCRLEIPVNTEAVVNLPGKKLELGSGVYKIKIKDHE